jgi:hypothetical protein
VTNAAGNPLRGPARAAALAVAALLLAYAGWRMLTLGLALHFAQSAPDRALRWRPGFPAAEMALESRRSGSAGARNSAAELRRAVGQAPLHPLGYRLLARKAELARQPERAAALYGLAAARGPRDIPSQAWRARYELATGDFRSALSRYDQIMRVQPEISHHLNATLMALAMHGPAQRDFARLLQRNPPWREDFVVRLAGRSPALAPTFPLMESLRTSPPGLSKKELAAWISRLGAEGEWGAAYLVWVQSLGPEASQRIGNVYNGGFELEPSHSGFDWDYQSGPGTTISRAQTSGAKESFALRIEFEDRRVRFPKLQQILALAPGEYRLKGRVRLDDLRSERGLVWRLECVGGGGLLGESQAFRGRREWTGFEVPFVVPASKCGGQRLSLQLPARVPAESRIGGVAWFDDMSIKAE